MIPFILMEDLLQGLTIMHSQRAWEIVESMADFITDQEFFKKGSNNLINDFLCGCNGWNLLRTVCYPQMYELSSQKAGKVM